MKRFAGLLVLIFTGVSQAAVHTVLEPRLVDEMETVQLILRIDGQAQAQAPDLAPLEEDFEVLGSQTSSRISSINGRTTAMVEYQINLRPKHTGEIRVPSIEVGGERSEAVTLMVRPLDPGLRQTIENMVFFETEISTNPVYVQAETVLIRRLFYSNGVQIYSDLPGVPDLPDAVVIPLGETRSYSTIRGGLRYGVIEQRFALFAERSGPLEIEPISVTSSVRLTSGGRIRRSGIRVSTEAITLDVLPIPDSYPPGVPWLPARNLQLSQAWQPERTDIDVGSQLHLTMRLKVEGNTSSAIPPLGLSLPDTHFKLYPEAPQLEESTAADSVTGSRTQRYALIPTAPGKVSLAPVSVTWWDTVADQVRTASLEAKELTIEGEAVFEEPPATSDAAAAPAAPAEAAATPVPATGGPASLLPWRSVALTTAALLLLAALAYAAYRLVPNDLRSSKMHPQQADFRSLEKALRGADLLAIRRTLLDFLHKLYGGSVQDALQQFRRLPGAAEQLDALDALLYQADPDRPGATAFSTEVLRELLSVARREARRHTGRRTRRKALDQLPPLSA
ncbi:MAG: BatD family protein [Pseudomonadales bacterium]|nr:BatD family protein [Pseudomonadales bacterium]